MFGCGYGHMKYAPQKPKGFRSSGDGVPVVVNCPVLMLGSETGSSRIVASTLNLAETQSPKAKAGF